jgi:hypothetical protein
MTIQKRFLWIPMPAAIRFLVLVAAHPKLRSFVRLCASSILSLRPKPPLAHYTAFISCHSFLRLLRTCTCPWFFLEKNSPIVIPQTASSPGPGHMLLRGIAKVYSSKLQLLPQHFNVVFTVFFCLSDGRVIKDMGFLV